MALEEITRRRRTAARDLRIVSSLREQAKAAVTWSI